MKKTKSGTTHNQEEKRLQTTHQLSELRLWLFRIIAVTVIPVIFFLLLELALRLANFGYPTTALIENSATSPGYLHENPAFAYRFFPKKLAREFVPLRFTAEKEKDVMRIIILGGSAAQGTPDAAFSFGRILDVMLQQRYPDSKFEILSLAMAAINSHVVLEIAEECAQYDPDLFVVYLGNNEVIGPYGPGTVFTPLFSNYSLLRLVIGLKATKISQLLSQGLEQLNPQESAQERWRGMEMFLENPVPLDDPGLEITYRHFNNNLERLNKISFDNNIKIIYSTVVSNLKDCPPFHSMHREDLSSAGRQQWQALYQAGSVHEQNGEYNEAVTKYLAAAQIDSHYADLHYRLGRCYWHSADFNNATAHYRQAREYDASRFRADKRINSIIRRAAGAKAGTTFLADALYDIEQKSPHGLPGKEFLLEHVHLNFKGNYRIALAVLDQMERAYSDVSKDHRRDDSAPLSDALCAETLLYNNTEQQRILDLVLNKFIRRPPFTQQLYHTENVHYLEQQIDSLQLLVQQEDSGRTIEAYEKAVSRRPQDWWLRIKYAEFLANDKVANYQEAAEQFQLVINAIPHNANAWVERGAVLAKLGRFAEALKHNQQALSINPAIAKAWFNSGLIYQKQGKMTLAVDNYRKAAFYQPDHSKAHNNLAFIFSQQGNLSEALAIIEQGLKVSPDDLHLNYNKAMILYQSGRKSEALEQLRHCVELAPQQGSIQEQLDKWLKE